jgi:microcin C transport system permease protein
LGILFFNFILLNLLNINPLQSSINYAISYSFLNHKFINSEISPQLILYLENYFELSKSFSNRFLHTCYKYLTFNLGRSFYNNQNVAELIFDHLRVSLVISVGSTLLVYMFSIIISYVLIMYNNLKLKNLVLTLLLILYIIPTFYIAIFFKEFFTSQNIMFAIICNVIGGLWLHSLFIKNLLNKEIQQPYYKFLSFNNQKPKILKNIIFICIADLPSILISMIFASSIFVEIIFNIFGVGFLMYSSFIYKDYPVILGIIFVMSLLGLIFRLCSDVIFKLIDKRLNLY